MNATTTNTKSAGRKSSKVNVPTTNLEVEQETAQQLIDSEVNQETTSDISQEVAEMLTPDEIELARRLRESQVDDARYEQNKAIADAELAKDKAILARAEQSGEATAERLLALQVENEQKNQLINSIRAARQEQLKKNPPKTTSDEVVQQLSEEFKTVKSEEDELLERLAAIRSRKDSVLESIHNVESQPEYELFLKQLEPHTTKRDANQAKIDSATKAAEAKIDAIRVALQKQIAPYILIVEQEQRQIDLIELTNPRRKSTPAAPAKRQRKYNGTTAASASASDKSTGTNLTSTYHVALTREQVMTISTNPASKVHIEKVNGVDTGVISKSLSTQQHRDYEAKRAIQLALGASLVPDEKGFKRVVGGSFDESINTITLVETK